MAGSSADTSTADDAFVTPASAPRTRLDRIVLAGGAWMERHARLRAVIVTGVVAAALILGIILLIEPDITDGLAGAGYAGVFLINLISTFTVAIPVPGLTATAQLLIISEAKHSDFPWLVGLVGGLGMGFGEITAYYAGYLGAELVKGKEMRGPRWLRVTVERAIDVISTLMRRWGLPTLFVLSAIPNPFFEIAGLSAGSSRIGFRPFLVAAVSGKVVRGLLLAYLGTQLPFV